MFMRGIAMATIQGILKVMASRMTLSKVLLFFSHFDGMFLKLFFFPEVICYIPVVICTITGLLDTSVHYY